MRRVGIFLLAVIALLAMTAPVSAQPKVTINGIVDNVTSITKNLSIVDQNPARSSDTEWYARTRVRPDIIAEVGTTKFVLGLEIDATWGQTGSADTNVCLNAGAAACSTSGQAQRFGNTHGWDLNTDVQGVIEIKWAYTEFGLPIMPIPTRIRLGAQPWEAGYKNAILAQGDFAGMHITNQWAPGIKSNVTLALSEESSTRTKDGFLRGDDLALVASLEWSPFKGLDIRPIYSYAEFIGPTSTSSRSAKGGVGTGAAAFPSCPGSSGPGTGNCAPVDGGSASAVENRHTIGVDVRWRIGAFYIDPTVMYQFGSRDQLITTAVATTPLINGPRNTLKLDAWLVDIEGGWQAGPLLIQGRLAYTTGNHAHDRIDMNESRIKYYQPISTDSGFWGGWGEIWSLNIDYFNAIRNGNNGLQPISSIGYDKYGLIRVGARASYALTPAFTLRTAFSSLWTAEEVDTSSTLSAATGLTPGTCTNLQHVRGCRDTGDSRSLGTEINLGFQWRFVTNVALDVVGSYMFAGPALSTHLTTGSCVVAGCAVAQNGRDPKDVSAITARVRYTW
jgi:hypothetical protein